MAPLGPCIRSKNTKVLLLLLSVMAVGLLFYFRNVFHSPSAVTLIEQVHSDVPTHLVLGGGEREREKERRGQWGKKAWKDAGEGKAVAGDKPQAADKGPIKLILLPQVAIATEGQPLQITCAATGNPPPLVKISTPGLKPELESVIQRYEQHGMAVLMFEHVSAGHAGKYTCSAAGEDKEMKFEYVEVTVLKKEPEAETVETKVSVTVATGPHEAAAVAPASPATWQERAKFQQAQVEKFCQDYNMAELKFKLPSDHAGSYAYYRHMLMDDKSKTIFCFAPKVGCTNLKVLFYVNQGLIPESEIQQSRDKVNQGRLEAVMAKNSFVHLKNVQREEALKTYFKFIMYRNPLERLVSGFRSKVQRYSLIGTKSETPHYNWLREAVYKLKHPVEHKAWIAAGSKTPVQISFPDFIDYWSTNPQSLRGDEHFRPISEICHPCRSRFDFYGNFKNFEEDTGVLQSMIHAKDKYLRHGYYNTTTETSYLLSEYYEQLTEEQKRAVFRRVSTELDFIYRVFPEELNTHKQILRIMDDIPSPVSV